MKKFFKALGTAGLVGIIAFFGFVIWVQARGIPTYAVPPPAYAATPVAATAAQVALGEKLVLSNCADCHLNRQTNRLSGQCLTDSPKEFGRLYSSNITQNPTHGIGAWTDAEVTTLLRTGIGRDGRYRIMMPQFALMSDKDVTSIIAYLHSNNTWVQPDPTPTHAQEPTLLAKVLVNTVMKPLAQPAAASVAPSLAMCWPMAAIWWWAATCATSATPKTSSPTTPCNRSYRQATWAAATSFTTHTAGPSSAATSPPTPKPASAAG